MVTALRNYSCKHLHRPFVASCLLGTLLVHGFQLSQAEGVTWGFESPGTGVTGYIDFDDQAAGYAPFGTVYIPVQIPTFEFANPNFPDHLWNESNTLIILDSLTFGPTLHPDDLQSVDFSMFNVFPAVGTSNPQLTIVGTTNGSLTTHGLSTALGHDDGRFFLVPEPTSFGLLASIVASGSLALGRRRKAQR